MVKTFTAQNIISVNPVQWVWVEGELVGLMVTVEVNYGELGMTHQVDIYEDLTPAQKLKAKQLYQFIRSKIEAEFLG